MDEIEKKCVGYWAGLGAAADGQAPSANAGRAERCHRLFGVIEGVRGQGIVRPTPFLSHGHEPGVAQGLEMEGEQGLGAVECGLEIADALLTLSEQVENPEAADVGEGVKERGVALEALSGGGGRHISTYQDMLIYASPTAPSTHQATAHRGDRRLFQRIINPTAATAASQALCTPLVHTGS